jgi:hypothetical protein
LLSVDGSVRPSGTGARVVVFFTFAERNPPMKINTKVRAGRLCGPVRPVLEA